MMHIAALRRRYIEALMLGLKTVESRLSRTRCEPFARVNVGDTVFLKQVSGPIRASATVLRVESFEDLTPAAIDRLRRAYNDRIAAPAAYWRERRSARYATLLWFDRPRCVLAPPPVPPLHGRGWLCLPGEGIEALRRAS